MGKVTIAIKIKRIILRLLPDFIKNRLEYLLHSKYIKKGKREGKKVYGDFEKNRIIPDCVRALVRHETVTVRNPMMVRPYQHVLEPLFAYLMVSLGVLSRMAGRMRQGC